MTLFLGRVTDFIELGSDGLSISTRLANQPGRTTLQKLFPAPDRPLAIGQVGSNILSHGGCDCSFASVVKEFFRWLTEERPRLTVNECATALAKHVGGRSTTGERFIWVVGFSPPSSEPEIYRINMQKPNDNRECEWRIEAVLDRTFVDGSGKKYVAGLLPDLRETYRSAAAHQQRAGEFSFGGHWHSLVVQPFGAPSWVMPPCTGRLGIEELLADKEGTDVRSGMQSPAAEIVSHMNYLKTEVGRRARLSNGRHARTIAGMIENWERERNPPDWNLVQILVAIGDEASVAAIGDVADTEAVLYAVHVRQLVESISG